MDRLIAGKTPVAADSAFARMIDPIRPRDFFDRYWDRRPVHISGAAGRFDDVMTRERFSEEVFRSRLGDRRIRYANKSVGDRHASLDLFIRKKAAWTERKSLTQLAEELHKGTVIFDSIEAAVPSAKAFCRAVFPDLGCYTTINAYFSAGEDASAFDSHFDPQDVFILQLEGEKEWQIWERERVLNPIPGIPALNSCTSPALPAEETVMMTPGDVLYVPRGLWHWPRSLSDAPSLHLTLTLVMPKPTDIVPWLTNILSKDPELRSSLPFSRHQAGAPVDDASLHKAIELLARKMGSPDARASATADMASRAVQWILQQPDAAEDD